jgi:hypothetical protein
MLARITTYGARLQLAIICLAVAAAMGPSASLAQSTDASPASLNMNVPTVKILAIGTFTTKGTPDKWKPC